MAKFDPNQVSFAQGAVRVEGVVARHRLAVKTQILTSKDEAVVEALGDLHVRNVPKGFTKTQLPFVFQQAQFFISHAEAGAKVAEHAHDGGDAIRFILHGGIVHKGVDLVAGDWMFIPKGVPYTIDIGRAGAVMGYCYACCCAGFEDVRDWIVDPAPETRG